MNFNPRTYVAVWLDKMKIDIDERGTLIDEKRHDYTQIVRTLLLDYSEQVSAYNANAPKDEKVKGATYETIKMALEEYADNVILQKREELAAKLQFSGTENLGPLSDFLFYITGQRDEKDLAVMAHWVWQVKRKLTNQKVFFHIMPMFYGTQGGGKSEAIKHLFGPVHSLTLENLSLTDIVKTEKIAFELGRCLVAFFDEMSGADKADVEALKRQITATHNDTRTFFTQKFVKVPQNVSFIGASNKALNELIYDPTGMRRFYQINTVERFDWGAINSLDYEALYKGINEGRETGYMAEKAEEIAAEQAKLVGHDDIEAFMEYYNINARTPLEKTTEISASEVYHKFMDWCELNGVTKKPSAGWFGRRISNKGIQSVRKKLNKLTAVIYLINSDSALHDKSYDPLGAPKTEGTKTWNN